MANEQKENEMSYIRTLGAAAASVGVALSVLAGATPAHAAGLTVVANCEPGGGYTAFCRANITGGTGTYTSIKWYRGPYHLPTVDNTRSWSQRCAANTTYTYHVVVTDSAGTTTSDNSRPVTCYWFIP